MLAANDTVVLFIDLQEAFVGASRTNPSAELRRSACALAELAARLALPAVVSAFAIGPNGPGVFGEILRALPDAPIIERRTASALASADTRRAVESAGKRNLILCGIATEVAVLHTGLDARALGLSTHIAVDAGGGLSARGEAAALRRLEAAGCATTSVPTLLTELVGDLGSADGGKVLDILVGLTS